MAMTRREILAGMAAAGLVAAQDGPRTPRPRTPPKPRTTPIVCLYSQHLIKVEYEAVGMILRDLGFDGCDLAVVPGSHIPPEHAEQDLMRGIEGRGRRSFIELIFFSWIRISAFSSTHSMRSGSVTK